MRSLVSKLSGDSVRVSTTFQPCFLAVPMTERRMANSLAPWQERNPPEIFCRSFIMRAACSARLLVKGMRGSVRKRNTSSLRSLKRISKLWPGRRGLRPRKPIAGSGGQVCARCSVTTSGWGSAGQQLDGRHTLWPDPDLEVPHSLGKFQGSD